MNRLVILLVTFQLATFLGCGKPTMNSSAVDHEARKQKIQARENNVSEEALARKKRSIAALQAAGVRVLESLPVIESESESKRRNSDEVAVRAMALCIVAVKGEGLEQDVINKLIAQFQLKDAFTPKELAFINNPQPTQHDRTQFVWRYECYWVMLWALGFVDTLGPPHAICDAAVASKILSSNGRDGFLKKAKLRPQAELLDAADLIYRYHWAVVDARVNNGEAPKNVDSGIVMERHYVLNWLIGYMDQAWDDISTDT